MAAHHVHPRPQSARWRARWKRPLVIALTSCLTVSLVASPAAGRDPDGPVRDRSLLRVVAPPGSGDEVRHVSRLPLGDDARARLAAEKLLKAQLKVSDASPEAGDRIVLRTRGSRARRGLKYVEIRFGDGRRTRGRRLAIRRTHAYATAGTYTATVIVKDRTGRKARKRQLVVVSPRSNTIAFGVEPPAAEDEVGIGADAPGSAVGAPTSVDLRSSAMPVQNQGDLNSCVSWTTAYGMVGWYYRKQYGQSVPFAPMYVYSQTYAGLDAGRPRGSHAKDALEVLRTQGVDTAAHYGSGWATAWNVVPNASQRANAAKYRISGWGTIFRHATGWTDASVGTTTGEIEAIKNRLAAGHPVAIAFRVRSDFLAYGSGWYGAAGGQAGGLHEMLVLGYNENGLIIQNSWGTTKGVGGYVFMTWAAVQRDVYEATFAHGLVAPASASDTVKPAISSFSMRFAPNYVANNSQGPMTFSWSGSDNVGVTKYVLYYRYGGSDWAQLAIGDSQTSATYNLGFNTTYQFAVAAYDAAGNLSEWALGQSFTPANYTEAIGSYSSGWFSYSDPVYMNGTLYESGQAGAQMSVQVTATNVGLVSTQGPAGGRAHVYLDGSYQFTIDNYRASASYRTVVAWFNFGSYGTHTIRVVVEGTAGRPYVDIDSILLS